MTDTMIDTSIPTANSNTQEPVIVVANREQLAYLLSEASEIEHGLMCCYLYAAFSLKRSTAEDLSAHELAAVDRFRLTIHDVARDEMLHLALVANIMTAIGLAPHLLRPNFPVWPGYHPTGVTLALSPFNRATLEHFIYMERPEGMDVPDGAGFVSNLKYHREQIPDRLMPSAQDYLTVGHLYRGILDGLRSLSRTLGEAVLFSGDPEGQVDERVFPLPGLCKVTDLASAEAAIERILTQGEGTSAAHETSHYSRFQAICGELQVLEKTRPNFTAARPVAHNPVMRAPVTPEARVHIDRSEAARVLDLANAVYTLMMRLLGRIFGPTEHTAPERRLLARISVELMQAMSALSDVLTLMPASERHPGVNAGITFTMSRSLDALPQRAAALALFRERALEMAAVAKTLAATVAPAIGKVAERLDRIAEALHDLPLHVERAPQQPAPATSGPLTATQSAGTFAKAEPAATNAKDEPTATTNAKDEASSEGYYKDAAGVEHVRGKHLVLHFDGKRCIHARHCVLGAPGVFLANVQGPWLHPDAENVENLVGIAHMCPSGAITYERTDGRPGESTPQVNALRLRENGPYGVTADIRISGGAPMTRATLCRCGKSANKPFCDGAHNQAGFNATGEPTTIKTDALTARGGPLEVEPQPNGPLLVVGNLEICAGTGRIVDRVTSARLCRCGGSATKPYCDGTHARIGFVAD